MRLALVGGGGFAKRVEDLALLLGHTIVGYFGDDAPSPSPFAYLGTTKDIVAHKALFEGVVVAFGAIDRASLKRRLAFVQWLASQDLNAPSLVSPHSVVGRNAKIGSGAVIGHNTILGPDCNIGPFAILNVGASVGHDTHIGVSTVLAPNSFVGGGAEVGVGCLVGPGAIVLQGRKVGDHCIIGAGTALTKRTLESYSTVWPMKYHITVEADSAE